VVFGKVVRVGVSDGDVVEETGTAEDKFFFPCSRFAQELFRVVGEDGHDELVKGFGYGGGSGVLARANGLGSFAFGIEGTGLQDDPFVTAAEDGGDVGVETDIDAFGAEIVGPIAVEALEVGEGDHLGEIWEEGFWVVVPKLYVRVVKQTFEDCAGDIWRLISCTEKKGDKGKDHFFAKFFVEEKHTEHDSDGHQAKYGHGVFD